MSDGAQRPRFVIGLTGPIGSGVTTLSHALAENGFRRISLSAPIKNELRRRKSLPTGTELNEQTCKNFRVELQNIGNEWRRSSSDILMTEALNQAQEQDTDIVVDGIRNASEIVFLRERFAPHFYLIALNASFDIRWRRVQHIYNQNLGLFERDDRRDADEENEFGQHVDQCVQEADYVIKNEDDAGASSATKSKLFNFLKDDLQLMRYAYEDSKRQFRPATPDEVHMATAYAQSHMSMCLKRHVGAVIVDARNIPLSLGYNENPVDMKPCIYEYQHCFKDQQMFKKLEALREIHCPQCGTKISQLSSPWKCPTESCGEDLKALFFPSRNMELCTAIHAEERAIRSLNGRSAEGATIFTTTFPCFQCARYLVDAGIKRVVYVEAYPIPESLTFLIKNGIKVDPFQRFKARAFNLVFKQRS